MADQDKPHPIVELKGALEKAEKAALALSESGDWMKSAALLTVFEQALKTHNRINGILGKAIERIQIQNRARAGGRF